MAKPLAQFFQDNQGNWDEQPVLSIIGVLTTCGLTAYTVVVLHHPFDPEAFGIGFGATMAATLGGLAYRESRGVNNASVSNQPGG